MADNVSRLKQLLFDNEAEALAELSRRLDLLQQDKVEANRRFDSVFQRAGTDERLQKSVAGVLDGALRDAEVADHEGLADAVAPVVVNTVKTEIRNSRDEIAEALYPMTGRMVKAYIASAMKDLKESLNRKLDSNPLMLRMRSMSTGQPIGDLLLADSQRVALDELFLIRRGTGELVARWPANDIGHNQDQVMSGILAAINDFASEALKDDGSSLREIDLGDRQVYLRASPVYLLAAKCSGSGSGAAEKVLDEAFLSAIEQIHALNDSDELDKGPETKGKMLALLAGDLQEDLHEAQEKAAAAREQSAGQGLSTLAWIVGIPLAIWMSWLVYESYWRARVTDIANQIVISSSELKGYPTDLKVSALGRDITLSGLAPSRYTKSSLVKRLQVALPNTKIDAARLAVLPTGDHITDEILKLREEVDKFRPDISALRVGIAGVEEQIAVATVRSNLAKAHRSVQTVLAELPGLEQHNASGNERALVARLRESALLSDRQLKAHLKAVQDETVTFSKVQELSGPIDSLGEEMRQRTGEMSSLLVDPNVPQVDRAVAGLEDTGVIGSTHALAVDSDHLATVAVAVAQLSALKKQFPKPPPPAKPYTPSRRQQLEEFARRHAVFFSTATSYRDARNTAGVLDELANHMSRTKAVLRVVGYTDEKGNSDDNVPLSQKRADKVVAALVRRGVPRQRIVALGRRDFRDISTRVGTQSPNRRVEFEIGFDNELAR